MTPAVEHLDIVWPSNCQCSGMSVINDTRCGTLGHCVTIKLSAQWHVCH